MSWNRRRRYVTVAERRAAAEKMVAKLQRGGRTVQPVSLQGNTIARSFWGKAWCTNLEAYSDYSNRLPRGRTYARNGSILDLQIEEGRIDALVSGSSLYEVSISIDTLPDQRWSAIREERASGANQVVEKTATFRREPGRYWRSSLKTRDSARLRWRSGSAYQVRRSPMLSHG